MGTPVLLDPYVVLHFAYRNGRRTGRIPQEVEK
jgi:hypothetical protein